MWCREFLSLPCPLICCPYTIWCQHSYYDPKRELPVLPHFRAILHVRYFFLFLLKPRRSVLSHEPIMHNVWVAYCHSLLVHTLHPPLLPKPFSFLPLSDFLMIHTPPLSVKRYLLLLFLGFCYKNWEASSLFIYICHSQAHGILCNGHVYSCQTPVKRWSTESKEG